uniref:Uncharacterized protein n=1 Tax=Ursus americanus TaxID=9643 RepID=A0A452R3E6_URSAM
RGVCLSPQHYPAEAEEWPACVDRASPPGSPVAHHSVSLTASRAYLVSLAPRVFELSRPGIKGADSEHVCTLPRTWSAWVMAHLTHKLLIFPQHLWPRRRTGKREVKGSGELPAQVSLWKLLPGRRFPLCQLPLPRDASLQTWGAGAP